MIELVRYKPRERAWLAVGALWLTAIVSRFLATASIQLRGFLDVSVL